MALVDIQVGDQLHRIETDDTSPTAIGAIGAHLAATTSQSTTTTATSRDIPGFNQPGAAFSSQEPLDPLATAGARVLRDARATGQGAMAAGRMLNGGGPTDAMQATQALTPLKYATPEIPAAGAAAEYLLNKPAAGNIAETLAALAPAAAHIIARIGEGLQGARALTPQGRMAGAAVQRTGQEVSSAADLAQSRNAAAAANTGTEVAKAGELQREVIGRAGYEIGTAGQLGRAQELGPQVIGVARRQSQRMGTLAADASRLTKLADSGPVAAVQAVAKSPDLAQNLLKHATPEEANWIAEAIQVGQPVRKLGPLAVSEKLPRGLPTGTSTALPPLEALPSSGIVRRFSQAARIAAIGGGYLSGGGGATGVAHAMAGGAVELGIEHLTRSFLNAALNSRAASALIPRLMAADPASPAFRTTALQLASVAGSHVGRRVGPTAAH